MFFSSLNLKLMIFFAIFGVHTVLMASQQIACKEPSVSSSFIQKSFNSNTIYKPSFKTCEIYNSTTGIYESVTVLRLLHLNNVKHSLFVSNDTLQTHILPLECLLNCIEKEAGLDYDEILPPNENRYARSLVEANSPPFPKHGDGIRHETSGRQKVYLTIDLCPSHKELDRDLFEKLSSENEPTQINIAISGLWLVNHREDFQYLKNLESENKIIITWINHTYSHPYKKNLLEDHNFLLMENVNLFDEVFKNEKLLLAHGIIPTVFIRFPGLVSDENIISKIKSWGLIPISTDAWLANDQKPVPGSIILVHGNGNERQGLNDLFTLLVSWPFLKNLFSSITLAFR